MIQASAWEAISSSKNPATLFLDGDDKKTILLAITIDEKTMGVVIGRESFMKMLDHEGIVPEWRMNNAS